MAKTYAKENCDKLLCSEKNQALTKRLHFDTISCPLRLINQIWTNSLEICNWDIYLNNLYLTKNHSHNTRHSLYRKLYPHKSSKSYNLRNFEQNIKCMTRETNWIWTLTNTDLKKTSRTPPINGCETFQPTYKCF